MNENSLLSKQHNSHLKNSRSSSLCAEAPRHFTLFAQLPDELQISIWKFAVPDPQIIRLKIEADKRLYDSNVFTQDDFEWEADQVSSLKGLKLSTPYTEAPGLSAACKNSRNVLLDVYKGTLKSKGDTVIRFDPENDTIFLIPVGEFELSFGCHDASEGHSSNLHSLHNSRKTMFLGLGTPGIPKLQPQRSRDYRSIFGGIKKLVIVWNELLCAHPSDITWTLSNFASLKELTLVSKVKKDAYCMEYVQAVGSPTIWCMEQISSHFTSADWLVHGLRHDMMTLDCFRLMLESLKKFYFREDWKIPEIIRFGGCFADWVDGNSQEQNTI